MKGYDTKIIYRRISEKFMLLTLIVGLFTLIGCGEVPETGENESLFMMEYYSEAVHQKTDIIVDDEVVGALKEDGIFDASWNYKMIDGTQFSYKFLSEDVKLNKNPEVKTADGYIILDKDGKTIYYIEKSLVEVGDKEDWYYLFYDQDKNCLDYCFYEGDLEFYDMKGKKLSSSEWENEFALISFKGSKYSVYQIFDKECDIPLMHKVFGYIKIQSRLNDITNHD